MCQLTNAHIFFQHFRCTFNTLPLLPVGPSFSSVYPPRISVRLIINYDYWLIQLVFFSNIGEARGGVGWLQSAARCVPRAAAVERRRSRKAGRRCSASQHSFARPLTSAVLSESSFCLPSIFEIAIQSSSSYRSSAGRKGKKG